MESEDIRIKPLQFNSKDNARCVFGNYQILKNTDGKYFFSFLTGTFNHQEGEGFEHIVDAKNDAYTHYRSMVLDLLVLD